VSGEAPELPWTGERCLPWIDDVQVVYEHLLRYHFAAQFCAGKRVIDLGCGEGYGSAMLAATAATVVGIEIELGVVEHARGAYQRPNLEFLEGSVLDLDRIPPASIDVAVCFEVLEHVQEHEQLLDGINRVLAPGGLLAISTPDRILYSERNDYHNPFHVHELDPAEFESLLRQHFSEIATWRQATTSAGSQMTIEVGRERAEGLQLTAIRRQGSEWVQAEVNAPYLLALVGETLPAGLPERVELLDPELEVVAVKTAVLSERDRELGAARSALARTEAEVQRTEAEAQEWRSRYALVTGTPGYRWLERLRSWRRLGRRPS
jgi:O-antigen biosynthesis protein